MSFVNLSWLRQMIDKKVVVFKILTLKACMKKVRT